MNVIDTIKRALAAAGLDSHAAPMKGVADTIGQALSAAGLGPRGAAAVERAKIIDPVARETGRPEAHGGAAPRRPDVVARPAGAGEFVSRSFSNAAGTRTYKLYVPAGHVAGIGGAPLVVMLHGCTQSPDDFAAGTRMNALADKHGFLVAYPEQAANANGSKCWNWFRRGDQGRDHGEPSIIAGITREVAAAYRVDERRIFVAGLSAGAAMAVILGANYPDLFAAVGAHSGLAHGAAHDMPSALSAMQGTATVARGDHPRANAASAGRAGGQRMPTIVFHGDRDHTVNVRNGAAIVAQATAGRDDQPCLRATVHEAVASGGRTHRHTVYADAENRSVVELWELHGAGHAWSGGCPGGSYTDAGGPDASAEMFRFFQSQPRTGRG